MRTFGLSDTAFGTLAAGRPTAATLAELGRAQLSRHLLRLRATGAVPPWYGGPDTAARLADPMTALHTAATLAAQRTGSAPPPEQVFSARRLTAEHNGLTLRVRLEDTDPLRCHLGVSPAAPLDPAAAAGWQHCLQAAWRLLVDRHRPAAETLAAVLAVIVPVEPDPGVAGISATSADAYGAVAISPTDDPTALAVGLLHEAQHSVLNATLVLFDLVRPAPERLYSPWRDDPRPALGVLHGAYAYQAVTRFWRAEAGGTGAAGGDGGSGGAGARQSSLAAFEFARWRAAVVEAADQLLGGDALTPAGRRFTGALRGEVAAWLDDPVDDDVARLAASANLEHRVRWRLRNLHVDPESVRVLVEAWRAGRPPPDLPSPVLREAGRRVLEHSERLARIHQALKERDQTGPVGSSVRPQADAQLGVRHSTLPSPYHQFDLEDLALRERPELIRAAWLALPDTDVKALAAWLTGR